MRIFSRREPRKPLSRAEARTSLIINQFATPGLGSLAARRWIAGLGQLALAIAGFVMIMGWLIQVAIKIYRLLNDLPERLDTYRGLGKIGGLVFLTSWLWAWVTSLSLLHEARRNEGQRPL